jgi:hypothetical protein
MRKQSGLKNETKVQKILVSGSVVLPQKNSKGLRIARKQKPSPVVPIIKGYSDLSDIPNDNYGNLSEAGLQKLDELNGGIISGKLVKAKYDNTELKKSIDTTIFELIPQTTVELPDVVLRSVYNEVTQSVNDLTIEVQILTTEVSTLNSEIQELEIVSESLKIEADNEKLKANIAIEQSNVANLQVGETTIDLSNAIQNSINEAIQRVSLTARNQALLQENESLREQLFGLSAQTAEGAQSGATNNFTVKINNDSEWPEDIGHTTSRNNNREMTTTLDVSNVTTDLTITSISFVVAGGFSWFTVDKAGQNTIAPETGATYACKLISKIHPDSGKVKPYKKSGAFGIKYWKGSATDYTSDKLTVSVTFSDGTTDSIAFTTHLRKNKG